jgi:hypothetical protein
MLASCLHDFDFRAKHIAGVDNTIADVLSRDGDCAQFRRLLPHAAPLATPCLHPRLPPPQQTATPAPQSKQPHVPATNRA